MTRDRPFYLLTVSLVMAGVVTLEAGAGSLFFVFASALACFLFYRNDLSAAPVRLPGWLANALSLGGFLLAIGLVYGTPGAAHGTLEFRVPVVGRYLMFVQWVLFFKEHSNRDFAWIYFISLTHVAGGALMMPELSFAFFYVLYTVLAIATLTVYQQKLEADLAGPARHRPAGRIGWSLLPKSAAGALALMLPVAFFFALLPRGAPGALGRLTRRSVQPITGFAESVRLGDLGRILENPERVMRVKVVDGEGRPLRRESLNMRGMALNRYDGRRWETTGSEETLANTGEAVTFRYTARGRSAFAGQAPRIRLEVTLEPLATRTLFVPFSVSSIRLPPGEGLSLESANEIIRTSRQRRRTLEYYVESRLVSEARGRLEQSEPIPYREPPADSLYLQLPEALSPRVGALAREIVRMDENPSAYERAARIERYLSDPANFRYTLEPRPSPAVEPVEDFLLMMHERKCEYFATAMAVMLRSVGVESRLVTGFAGGEWHAYTESLLYRQRDAHAWVEVNLPQAGWFPFDPNPSLAERHRARDPGLRTRWREFVDFLERSWIEYVVAFDREKQSAFYAFMRKPRDFLHHLMTNAIWRVAGTETLIRDDLAEHLADRVRRYRPIAFAFAGAALAAVAWLAWRKARKWRLSVRFSRSRPAHRFYAELLRVLRRRGFPKPERLTPAEFAASVNQAVGEAARPAAEITWAYYEARYGGRRFGPDELRGLREELRRLDRALAGWRREHGRRGRVAAE